MNWHISIATTVALTLAGCSNPALQERTFGILTGEPVQETPTQFPRFQPVLQAGKGPALNVRVTETGVRGGFLREAKRGNIESWLGNDGVSLTFDRGVLHGTRGIGAGLLASDVSQVANAVLAGRSGEVQRIHTYLNGNDQAVSRAYSCTITNQGSETIDLDTGATSTRRMSENCRNLDQAFTNTYWVDPRRGTIVQSRQWGGEDIGELAITKVFNF